MPSTAPVVTIDGPSGSGKGTVAKVIAERLGWHLLDSGAIYRVLALAALHHNLELDDEDSLSALAAHLDVSFEADTHSENVLVILEGEDVSSEIRTEKCGAAASKVAAFPRVREALLRRQRAFRATPGLVADGRDMGTVVFTDAEAKIFMTASAEERAKRRFAQLQSAGQDVNLARILSDIEARDERDQNRKVAPLKPADDAFILDTTLLNKEQVIEKALEFVKSRV